MFSDFSQGVIWVKENYALKNHEGGTIIMETQKITGYGGFHNKDFLVSLKH